MRFTLEELPIVRSALEEALKAKAGHLEMEVMVGDRRSLQVTKEIVEKTGGELLLEEKTYAQVKVPLAQVSHVVQSVPALAFGANPSVRTSLTELTTPAQALSAGDVNQRSRVSLGPSGILQFRDEMGVMGSGVKIAIIDSGIDPGHPDLKATPDGRPKVIDWKDFTHEGLVKLTVTVPWGVSFMAPGGRSYRLPQAPEGSLGGRFGYWDESNVPGRINRDLDRNNSPVDRFGVLAVDSQRPGVYDLVYVDANNNLDFTDEVPLRVFRESQSVTQMGRLRGSALAQRQLSIVLADIDPRGTEVVFGFDSLGHGTQVAGVAAASGPGLTGVAPGAQLLALKVITSRDEGRWFAVREAVQYAVDQGATIINISLGGLTIASAHDSAASAFLNQIATEHDVLIILAAGNTGPGLSSGATLGNPSDVLSVGAYYSPDMWKRDYGLVVPSEGVWWRSGMGPRRDGAHLPNLVAPGGGPSTSPHWLDSTGYATVAGTSIAVPHVAGAAALLLEAAERNGLAKDHRSIRRSLEQGARRLLGIPSFEQGHGLLTLPRAYRELLAIRLVPALVGKGGAGGEGLFLRAYRPGNDTVTLTNLTRSLTRVNVYSSDRWVQPAFRSLSVPPGQERRLPLTFDPPTMPGVHSAFLLLVHPDQVVPSVTLPVTYVQPVSLDERRRFSAHGELEVTRSQRYFVDVKPGATRILVSALVAAGEKGPRGSVQLQVFRPDGQMVYRSGAIGAGGLGLSASFSSQQPIPGVWEVVVTALPDSDGANLTAQYNVEVQVPDAGLSLPLHFTVTPGARLDITVPLVNTAGVPIMAKAEAFGLTRRGASEGWRVVKQLYQIDDFTLTTTAGALVLEVQNVIPSSGDLDLWLYRYDLSRGWEPYWSSTTREPGQERLQLRSVPPGRYQVFTVYNGATPSDLQYQYRRSVLVQNYQLDVKEQPRRREFGQSWSVPLTIYAPPSAGRYQGHVALTNTETGEIITWYPMEVSVGQPTLDVQPLVSQLRLGRPGVVVFEVRDSQNNRLVNGAVTINGIRYTTKQGRVSVPVLPSKPVQSFQVEIDLPAYQFYQQEIRVPVRNTWGVHPTGVETNPEYSQWRRKVESFLP
ncbi:MAG: S8 family serine peptidase [Bacillota bacterium]